MIKYMTIDYIIYNIFMYLLIKYLNIIMNDIGI